LESIDTRAAKMRALFSQGVGWTQYLETGATIDALSKDDIVRIARTYFNDNYFEVTKKTGRYPKDRVTKPPYAPVPQKNTGVESAYAQSLALMERKEQTPRFLDFDKDVQTIPIAPLSTLYFHENKTNELFTVKFQFGVGTLECPKLVQLAIYLHLIGTEAYSYEQFRSALQNLGSTLTFEAESNYFMASVTGFDAHFEETMQLVFAFFKEVKADPKKLKTIVDNKRVENKSFLKTPANTILALMQKTLYGKESKYLQQLSLSEVKSLTGTDLITLFGKVLHTECAIHYCGTLPAAAVADLMTKSGMPEQIVTSAQSPLFRASKEYDQPVVYIVDDPKATQTIVYGYITGPQIDNVEERGIANLFNTYFGRGMSSLMFQEIRELRSFAYGTNSSFLLPQPKNRDKNSSFVASLSTQADKTVAAMELLDSLLKNMPLQEERLAYAKQNVANSITNDYPLFRDISVRIATLKGDGYDCDPASAFLAQTKHVQLCDLESFYTTYIHEKPVVWMVVGNLKKLNTAELAKFGHVEVVRHNDIFKK